MSRFDRNNEAVFAAFMQQAHRRMEEKRKRRRFRVRINGTDMEVEFRGITSEEFDEIRETYENSTMQNRQILYYSSKDIQELAAAMMEHGQIREHIEVTDLFSSAEINAIDLRILEISGLLNAAADSIEFISETEEVKN